MQSAISCDEAGEEKADKAANKSCYYAHWN